ncbi:hypothetical protein UFOVP696_92 [uncultured Caudovirales phage]|uniref:Uncharacterized protein n=1 Tax=uncultured Caudovirales phage TaxID=2100421 RepID=A0A6J5MNR8_9CAUD|nr:hypothetical protein UFOVP429_75 [uncultured Caudovirales phage]CAB4158224.1 hypothetical protein UFOVP696_92 [uncultured Caudovirales phage]
MDFETVDLIVGRAKVCKKIRATAVVEYDVEEVLLDLRTDYPEENFTEEYVVDMIHKWIKDDFENTLAEVRIEEING